MDYDFIPLIINSYAIVAFKSYVAMRFGEITKNVLR